MLFDYEADNEEELTLKVDQFIEVTRDAIHLCNVSRAPTNFSCRSRRKTTVGGGKAKPTAKRCVHVHAFPDLFFFPACSDDGTLMQSRKVYCFD